MQAIVAELSDVSSLIQVITEPSELQIYASTLATPAASHNMPALAVLPSTTHEIQDVLRIAREQDAPVWTFYNGADVAESAPKISGCIALDLQNMKQVVEVNDQLAYCLVEPGVTYSDLVTELKERGSSLWVDAVDNPDESVVATFANRNYGYTPNADHFLMQCGMEVMLSDGELVRTGMGAMPNSDCWQLFKYGFGPWLDGAFVQSNYGIITKLGIWMMPSPPASWPFMVTVDQFDSLKDLVDALRPLKLGMVVPNGVAITNGLYEAALHGVRPSTESGAISQSESERFCRDIGVGEWNLFGCLYGSPENVDFLQNVIRDTFGSIAGAKVYGRGERPADDPVFAMRAASMTSGSPQNYVDRILRWNGGSALDVNPVTAVDGSDALAVATMHRDGAAEYGFDCLISTKAVWRDLAFTNWLCYDGADEQRKRQALDGAETLIARTAEGGFGQYRSAPELEDAAVRIYNWNNSAQSVLSSVLKDALDPADILSPGKAQIGSRK